MGATALEKSAALVRADGSPPPPEVVAPEVSRAVAAAISAAQIPLPPGFDTAASLDWPGQSGFGPITLADVHQLLQVNAARDWIWFAAHDELSDEQRQILAEVPRWPRLRGTGFGRACADAIERILAGDLAWAREYAASQFRERGGRPPERAEW